MPSKEQSRQRLDVARLRPLPSALVALLGLHAATAKADWTVTSCDDASSGSLMAKTGTLRFAAANATSGELISLSSLNCSQISLTTGAVDITANDVELVGPSDSLLLITAKYANPGTRVLRHLGTGTLDLRNLAITGGDFYVSNGAARGGCVFSAGTVELHDTLLLGCKASTNSANARGGAVYATRDLIMVDGSSILSSSVDGGSNGDPRGGGAYVLGSALVQYSTISGNSATRPSGSSGFGGGLFVGGSLAMLASTVDRNYSGLSSGGIAVDSVPGTSGLNHVSIANSTISSNTSAFYRAGLSSDAANVDIRNTTIAFNHSGSGYAQNFTVAAGLQLTSGDASPTFLLESNIISNNTVGATNKNSDFFSSKPVLGSFNLIRAPKSTVPPGTLTGACPRLGALRNNGGGTQTHALLSGSPARDAGTDSAKQYDQRGYAFIDQMLVEFPRVSGVQADIGAYEIQQDDIVFNVNFEDCPPLGP